MRIEGRVHAWKYAGVVLACLLIVLALDGLTNELDTARYYWDFALYYDMAENGLADNDHLVAPFAYRFATPLLARGLSDLLPEGRAIVILASADGTLFATRTFRGFWLIAIAGAAAQLALTFVLAERIGISARRAFVAVLVVALSLYNVRFLLFDVSRPDHLAYPLMVVGMLAAVRRKVVLCLVVSCAGLMVREFLIIPPVILIVLLAQDYRVDRSPDALISITAVALATGLCLAIPRAIIPVTGTGQYIDPVNDPDSLGNLLKAPLSERRDYNILFNVVSYTMPTWLLLTRDRLKRMWQRLDGWWLVLGVYTALVLLLTLYGGTDIWRFISYLFIPVTVVLAAVLRDKSVGWFEVVAMLVAVAAYNKLWLDIPNLHAEYLDFYGGYDSRVNAATAWRIGQMGLLLAGMLALRGALRWRSARRAEPRALAE
jgi:hypothetical protein